MRLVVLARRHPLAAIALALSVLAVPIALWLAHGSASRNPERTPASTAARTAAATAGSEDAAFETWEILDYRPEAPPAKRQVPAAASPERGDRWARLSTTQLASLEPVPADRGLELPTPAGLAVDLSAGEKSRLLAGESVENERRRERGPIVNVGLGGVCRRPPPNRYD